MIGSRPDYENRGKNILVLVQVTLDPVLTGFSGVILELSEHGGVYTLFEMAAGSGNRLLEISSRDEAMVRWHFEKELEGFTRLAGGYEGAGRVIA